VVRRDRAWSEYFVVQVYLDFAAAARIVAGAVGLLWERSTRPLRGSSSRAVLICWPLLVPVAAAVLSATVGMAAGLVVAAVIAVVITVTAWILGTVAVRVMRAVDRLWQVVFRAAGSCPDCYYVTRLPAYRCPGPHSAIEQRDGDDLHRDLRPGLLGVLWRRCACGHRLPTTLLRASRQLDAYCPACRHPLHQGAAVATDVRIPVFGAASAGKTHLIMAGLVALNRLNNGSDLAVSLLDGESRKRYAEYERRIDLGISPDKTQPEPKAVGVTINVRTARRNALVHVFDAAGEALVDAKQNESYAYLDYARTLIFVLDPFSIPDVRDLLRGPYAALLTEANAARHDPEDSYNATITRLRRYGVRTAQQRLAFVVSKADLLDQLPDGNRPPAGSSGVRRWLSERRLDNLLLTAERDFGSVQYFAVSAKNLSPDGAVAPFRWLLNTDRVSVS
jgi:hypothetical protein